MHGAEICQVSSNNNNNNNNTSPSDLKCSTTTCTMEQPTVIISQPSRIQSVGHPLTNLLSVHHQPHIAYGGDLAPLAYQQHSLDQQHQNVWTSYHDEAVQQQQQHQHQYSQRSLVITQTPVINANHHFSADVNELRDHLDHHHQYQAVTMDDNNNNTLHQTVDEVIANTLKDDEHCIHASPVSHHGGGGGSPGSHTGSPEHGHGNSNVQFLNLGSAQNTISENLNQLKYPRQNEQQQLGSSSVLVSTHSDSRSSPVSQVSEYESDLQNFTQLTSVVSRNNNNNNLAIYSPTSQAGGAYENVR